MTVLLLLPTALSSLFPLHFITPAFSHHFPLPYHHHNQYHIHDDLKSHKTTNQYSCTHSREISQQTEYAFCNRSIRFSWRHCLNQRTINFILIKPEVTHNQHIDSSLSLGQCDDAWEVVEWCTESGYTKTYLGFDTHCSIWEQ